MLVENIITNKGIVGVQDKIKIAIEQLQTFEPPEGYYLSFSGGKDSQCIYHLAKEAGVRFDAHYNLTTVDPPELVYFIKRQYPDVIVDRPELSMWQLIPKKLMPPTRLARYCCEYLKEHGGDGRFCITGVRWAESSKRKNRRALAEIITSKGKENILLNNIKEGLERLDNYPLNGKKIINPIIDWEEEDVWEYIHNRKLKYCGLYDEGFHRLGCVGCPMARKKGILKEFERWPKYRAAYLRAFDKMIKERKHRGLTVLEQWKDAEHVMQWWIYGSDKEQKGILEGQVDMFKGEDIL
jgi:phosphoadenosine phosphosulfate reductase